MAPSTMLFIHFAAPVTDTGDSPVVTEVFDANLSLAWRGTIPLASGEKVTVKNPGPYLVRAWLPNGELISAQTEPGGGPSIDVPLYPELHSPGEDFAWAYYVQPKVSSADVGMIDSQGNMRSFTSAGHAAQQIPRLRVRAVFGNGRRNAKAEAGKILTEDVQQPVPVVEELRLRNDRPTRLIVRAEAGQVWLEIEALRKPATVWWAALPTIYGDEEEVLLSPDPLVEVRVNVRTDPVANALLSYLNQGDLAMARVLTEPMAVRSEQMLRQKRADPILATIAAYSLLRAGDFKRMHDWSFNLAKWFEDLPDGPVIAAWHVLKSSGELGEARFWFRTAVDRGVPLFSAGLRLLFELGEIIASAAQGDLDKEDRARIDWVRRLEGARQRWSPTTVLKSIRAN